MIEKLENKYNINYDPEPALLVDKINQLIEAVNRLEHNGINGASFTAGAAKDPKEMGVNPNAR